VLAQEQGRAEPSLKLLHARRHIGLHAMQLRRRPRDPALLGDRLEDLQRG
jgi:hypothetical protein